MKSLTKLLIASLLIIFLLTFSACSELSLLNGTSGGSKSSSQSDGVVLEIPSFPSELWEDTQNIKIPLIFKNYENHKISDLELRVRGIDSSLVKINGINSVDIEKNIRVGVPGITQKELNMAIYDFDSDFTGNVIFNYCYDAQSEYVGQICVPKKYETSCGNPKSETTIGPLQIKIDDLVSINDDIRVTFRVTNSGAGKIVNACFDEGNQYVASYNVIEVKVGSKTICSDKQENYIEGQSTFTCNFKRADEEEYTTQVSVKISYKYSKEVSKQINVRSYPEQDGS